jgi:hypothetical protein
MEFTKHGNVNFNSVCYRQPGRTGETYETFTTVCEFAHEEHQCENAFDKISIISR